MAANLQDVSLGTVNVPSVIMSDGFYIGSGTVTVDPRKRKWLGIHYGKGNYDLLPRGRLDWDENAKIGAERETFEETGYRCKLLPSYMPTRATAPSLAATDPAHLYYAALKNAQFSEDGNVLEDGVRLTEPFAILPHFQENGALALVLFFLAVGDSRIDPVPGSESGRQMDEEYEPVWYPYDFKPPLLQEKYWPIVTQGVQLAKALAEKEGIDGMLKDVQAYWEPYRP